MENCRVCSCEYDINKLVESGASSIMVSSGCCDDRCYKRYVKTEIRKKEFFAEQEQRKTIAKLETVIHEAIDKLCKDDNYEITYAEINRALVNTMNGNLKHELKHEIKEIMEIQNEG